MPTSGLARRRADLILCLAELLIDLEEDEPARLHLVEALSTRGR